MRGQRKRERGVVRTDKKRERERLRAQRKREERRRREERFRGVLSLQVSELQLNEAIASAVERSKLRREKSLWSIDGNSPSTHTTPQTLTPPTPTTPYVKPSDACTAVLTCQSRMGEGRGPDDVLWCGCYGCSRHRAEQGRRMCVSINEGSGPFRGYRV